MAEPAWQTEAEMVPLATDATDHIVLLLDSPDQRTTYPDLRHAELMTSSCAAGMDALWRRDSVAIRQIRFIRLEDVFVAEEGLVFDARLHLVAESRTQHSVADIARGVAAIGRAAAAGQLPVIDGPAVLAKKSGCDNYGHWMMEMLPKAFLAARHLGPGLRHIVPGRSSRISQAVLQSLTMAGIALADVRPVDNHQPVLVRELILVDGLTDQGDFISPRVLDCFDHLAGQVPADPPAPLYVSRASAAYRNLAGEADIITALAAEGIRVIDPGRASLTAQIAAFKGAAAVAGVMGAGLTNIGFAPAGIPIVDLAPASMTDTMFWMLAGARGQRYHEIRCAQTGPRTGPAEWDTALVLTADDLRETLAIMKPARP